MLSKLVEKTTKQIAKSKVAIKAKPGQVKTQAKAFSHAMKTTPGESLGAHIKSHRIGTTFTAVGVGADAADMAHDRNVRRSSHQGIDQRS